jgi:hypothetical protein
MKLVSENSETDIKKHEASTKFEVALEHLAINILRVIAGAGSPGSILHQMQNCLIAATIYQDAYGHFPAGIASQLDASRCEEQQRAGWSAENRSRWEADGTVCVHDAEMLIRIASLRVVAAQWAGNRSILSRSESEFHAAFRELQNARAERKRIADEDWRKRTRPRTKPKRSSKTRDRS